MSIDPNLLIAAKMIHDECVKNSSCTNCKLRDICGLERSRIEWLRMLPDDEMAKAMDNMQNGYCSSCEYRLECSCDVGSPCNKGHMDWWHEVVTLEQFRKDVGMNY